MDNAKKSRINKAIALSNDLEQVANASNSEAPTASELAKGLISKGCDISFSTARFVAGEWLKIRSGEYTPQELESIGKNTNQVELDLDNSTDSDSDTSEYNGAVPHTPEFKEYCETHGIPINSVTSAKFINHAGQNAWNVVVKYDHKSAKGIGAVRDEIINQMKEYSPAYPKYNRPSTLGSPEMGIISLNDLHVGKLAYVLECGSHHDNEVLIERVYEGVASLLERMQASRNIEKIILINGGDELHTDGHRQVTTAGTPQDTDGSWYGNFLKAKEIFVDVIEMCLEVAPVHFVHAPGNHSWVNGTLLADTIATWFRKCSDFTSDVSLTHRKYALYGSTLLGFTHGDGAKEADLPDLMKTEARQAWAQAKYGMWITNHIHHKDRKARKGKSQAIKIEKEYGDVLVLNRGKGENPRDYVHVEYMKTPTGTDSWHNRNGYDHQPPAIEAFIIHPEHGMRDRLTEYFDSTYE